MTSLASRVQFASLRARASAGLLFVLLAGIGALQATLVPRMSLEEVVDASESIVHGTVTRTWTDWDEAHKYIWTHYEIQVMDKLKGDAPGTLVVSEPGGTVGETELQIVGTPHYEKGEEVVLFAERTPLGYLRTCGWGQGKFNVERSGASGRTTVRTAAKGIELIERPAAARLQAKGTPLGAVNGLDLDQFKTRVRSLVAQRAPQTPR
jgi:hypothetical protein